MPDVTPTPTMEDRLAQIRDREERASAEVAALCTGGDRRWRMTIPADPARDSDLLISASLADVPTLLAAIEAALSTNLWAVREAITEALTGRTTTEEGTDHER